MSNFRSSITPQITAPPNILIPKTVKMYTIKKSNTKYNPRSIRNGDVFLCNCNFS